MKNRKTTIVVPSPPSLNAVAVLAGLTDDDLYAANLRADAESSRGTRSANTERALRDDVLLFSAWCTNAGLKHMPASAETVAAFVDAQAAAGKAPATVRRYAASIAAYHRSAKAENPLKLKVATDALKRMGRASGEDQRKAKGITDDVVVAMLNAAGQRLIDLRNKALLVVAYSTLCRRSELVALRAEDVQVDSDGFGVVRISRSKTDQTGRGASVAITADAMFHLQRWLDAACIENGPLFRRVNRHRQVGAQLDPQSVLLIFRGMAKAVRPRMSPADLFQISGHSTRVGAAMDMVRYGADIAGAMQAGRWKSPEMVARYCEGMNLKRGAVAMVAQKRARFA